VTDAQCFPTALKLLSDATIWIGDTGASVDMTPVAEGLMDARPCQISVHVGNSQHTAATRSGYLSVIVCDNTGTELFGAAFPDMHLVPQAPLNIVSLFQRMENGWRLAGDRKAGIILSKDNIEMRFDTRIETAKGVLWAICMKRKGMETAALAPVVANKKSIHQATHFLDIRVRKRAERQQKLSHGR
jgi:hypothetical protein